MMIRGNISRGGVEIQKAALPRRVRGFTLIEMMVVTAVIAILAAILLGALPAMTEKRARTQVRAELRQLVTAIEAYKEKHGFYPPDGVSPLNPPLFYELIGTTNQNDRFYPLNGDPPIDAADIQANYEGPGPDQKMKGFANSSPDGSEVKNFLTNLRDSQYVVNPYGSAGALALKVSANGPPNPAKPGITRTNTWRYIVARPRRLPDGLYPTNNPSSFDLWAEVLIRGRTNVIGNWKEE